MLLCAVYSRFYYHQMIRSYKPLTTPLCWISLKFSRQCELSILRTFYRSTWIFVSLIVSIYNLNFSMAARQNHIEISVIYRILTIRKFKMNKFELQPHKKTLTRYFVKTIWRVEVSQKSWVESIAFWRYTHTKGFKRSQ